MVADARSADRAGDELVLRSADAARAAALRAGVVVRALHSSAEMAAAAELVAQVWQSADTSPLDASLLRAFSHTHNYVAGAFEASVDELGQREDQESGALVGLSVGFRTVEPRHGLHSHITCAAPELRDAGLGAALKQHQRSWALANGLTSITWTFDPLVRRNAYFNIAKLGVRTVAYLPEFYGPMDDGVNAGDESDRLFVSWDLLDAPAEDHSTSPQRTCWPALEGSYVLAVGAAGEPERDEVKGDVVTCQIPDDIVAMRQGNPSQALRWRRALREALLNALSAGYIVQDFTRSGCYVLTSSSAGGRASAPARDDFAAGEQSHPC